MMQRLGSVSLTLAAAVGMGGALGFYIVPEPGTPQKREITVHARKYAYDPEVIHVNRGDEIHVRLISDDVTHGFYLEGYDLDAQVAPLSSTVTLKRPSQPGKVQEVEEVVFTASRAGKFRYRCSHTCGYMHPFMLGVLIVAPNRLLPASMGMAVGMLLGGVAIALTRGGTS